MATLAQSLELPLPPTLTKVLGIHQGDVIIRSALQVALADLRANPWLLDYVFASLPQDTVTWKTYGEKSVQAAKEWLLKTEVPVVATPHLSEAQWPVVTVSLMESSEAVPETTLGDVHSEPEEDNDRTWPVLAGPLTPAKYDVATGKVTLRAPLPNGVRIFPGMHVVDRLGTAHEILDVSDQLNFEVAENTVADFRDAVIKGHRPAWRTTIESASYRETYRIGVHVAAEPTYLTWLHSAVVFCLLRYKQALLEARGFERSVIQSSDFSRDESMESELVFSRYVTVTGYVRQYWPKLVTPRLDGVELETLQVDGGGSMKGAGGGDVNVQLWTGDEDVVDPLKR